MKRIPNSRFYSPRLSFGGAGIPASRRGQITIEALVAISVLVFGFLGAFTLLSHSFFFNRVATDNYTASYLAAEGIEIVKNIVDNNYLASLYDPNASRSWRDILPDGEDGEFEVDYNSLGLRRISSCDSAQPLRLDAAGNFYGYSGATETAFSRCVQIALVGAEEMRVNSIVFWHTGDARNSVNLEDRFFDWRSWTGNIPSYFKYVMTVDDINEQFIVKMTSPATIQQALDDLNGTRSLIVSGIVNAGSGGFNSPWSWHLDPVTIALGEFFVEVCDASPSYIEANLADWLGKRYCPFGARIAGEV